MELWELSAREHIRDLVAKYNANADSGRYDEVVSLFTNDATIEIGEGDDRVQHHGHDGIRALLSGAATRWAPGDQTPRRTVGHHVRHRVATHVIDFDDATRASGYSYFSVLMPHGLDHWGRYLDRYELREGRWLFAYRRAVTDGHIGSG